MTTTAEAIELPDAAEPAENEGLPENLLKCVKCSRPMRPRGVTKAEMPGTVATGHSGMCKSDAQPNGPGDRVKRPASDETPEKDAAEELPVEGEAAEVAPAPEDPAVLVAVRARRQALQDLRIANTAAGLDSFMAARRKRLHGGLFATEVRIVGRRVA